MTTNDGGQAFPYGDHDRGGASGMTLRDWLAGQALAGYCAFPHSPHREVSAPEIAKYLYEIADAMLEARGA